MTLMNMLNGSTQDSLDLLGELSRRAQTSLAQMLDMTDNGAVNAGVPHRFPGVPLHTIVLPDVILDRDGFWRVVEFNASNAAGFSAFDGDMARTEHMIKTIVGRGLDLQPGMVILCPRSPDTRATPEIKTRADLLAVRVKDRLGLDVHAIEAASGALRADAVNVVSGTAPELAGRLSLASGVLRFDTAVVGFLQNSNVLIALSRNIGVPVEDLMAALAADVVHEGREMGVLSFDKHRQQALCAGTDVKPIVWTKPGNLDELLARVLEFVERFGACCVKPNGTSGGTGVMMFDRTSSARGIRDALGLAAARLAEKYGAAWATTCPLIVYEFVEAMPAAGYRWDMRTGVLATPESTLVVPLLSRFCAEGINATGRITVANAVTNLTPGLHGKGEIVGVDELAHRLRLDVDTFTTGACNAIHSWMASAADHLAA